MKHCRSDYRERATRLSRASKSLGTKGMEEKMQVSKMVQNLEFAVG